MIIYVLYTTSIHCSLHFMRIREANCKLHRNGCVSMNGLVCFAHYCSTTLHQFTVVVNASSFRTSILFL